jgi:hypothetical protein
MRIARALARLPGRAQVDEEEARQIAADMAEWYLHGLFCNDEVLVLTVNPRKHQPLAEVVEGAWRPDLPILMWSATVFLTAPATRRYLEGCGMAGAPRLLRELFGAAEVPTPEPGKSKAEPQRKGRHSKPGPEPKKRIGLADKMFDDLRLKRRTPEALKRDTLLALTKQYGGSPNTAKDARQDALARFAEFHKSNSETNSEKL